MTLHLNQKPRQAHRRALDEVLFLAQRENRLSSLLLPATSTFLRQRRTRSSSPPVCGTAGPSHAKPLLSSASVPAGFLAGLQEGLPFTLKSVQEPFSETLLLTASLVLPGTLGSPSLEQRWPPTAQREEWTFRLHTETPPW